MGNWTSVKGKTQGPWGRLWRFRATNLMTFSFPVLCRIVTKQHMASFSCESHSMEAMQKNLVSITLISKVWEVPG